MTILQRRLASSPEAIYQSIKRCRERLQKRLREEELLKRGSSARIEFAKVFNLEDLEDDLEDIPSEEREAKEEEVADLATASRTIAELQVEINLLQELEQLALQVRCSGTDKKWEELSQLLQNISSPSKDLDSRQDSNLPEFNIETFNAPEHRRKLVIFTEYRDTLNYLAERIRTLLGRTEAVVTIYGGMGREERSQAQEGFTQDIAVQVLMVKYLMCWGKRSPPLSCENC